MKETCKRALTPSPSPVRREREGRKRDADLSPAVGFTSDDPMKAHAIHSTILAATVLLGFLPQVWAGDSAPSSTNRVLWHNRRLIGSPEPPAPYRVEKTFQKINWKSPMYVAAEPGTDQLWVVLQGGEKERPSRIVRMPDNPETAQ